MKAMAQMRFGGPEVLESRELPDPKPGAGEVLIRVRATSVNPLDSLIRKGKLWPLTGRSFPKVLGCDVAGEVVSVGQGVSGFRPGDRVFGMVNLMNRKGCGANGELAVAAAKDLAILPESISYVDGACLPVAGATALLMVKNLVGVKPGDRVLVNGATGGVGSFTVQLAKLAGAHVTAVCSARNAAFARELGADEVLPYDQGDFRNSGQRWRAIFDVAGTTSFFSCRKVLEPGGIWAVTSPNPLYVVAGPVLRAVTGRTPKPVFGSGAGALLPEVAHLVAQGKVRVHVEKTLPLEKLAEAHAAMDRGGKGKIAVTVP